MLPKIGKCIASVTPAGLCFTSTSMARGRVSALLLVGAAALRQPQTVVVRDVHSKRYVTLVGAMHYNPVSIALAERCVAEAVTPKAARPKSHSLMCPLAQMRTFSGLRSL